MHICRAVQEIVGWCFHLRVRELTLPVPTYLRVCVRSVRVKASDQASDPALTNACVEEVNQLRSTRCTWSRDPIRKTQEVLHYVTF